MTLKNRDLFIEDPLSKTIPNDGVSKVLEPRTNQEWEVLRYELENFVCDGEYKLGLERILTTYLTNISRAEQPAAWVSGFYGSGKSHLVRVLEYLWRDVTFPDGASARGLTKLPTEIQELLRELSTFGKREGGLWSAAGTLAAGAGKSVRLALLGILFRSAGLPDQYAPARLVIWLQQNGYYQTVKDDVEAQGRDFARELNNMYVSPYLAGSLLKAYPAFAHNATEARGLLKTQYPNRDDISDEELLLTMEDVLALQATAPGKLPATLLVFDELQQFIGEDSGRTLQVQTIVEACSSRFGSRLLFVATGQAALQATPQLSKLQGRFTVRVTLSDTDVEKVVREVVLRKKEDKKPPLKQTLEHVSGEIDRQLAGTKIGPRSTDASDLVPDYPLLPVRRRFWESVLRAIDSAGTAGQLRTQLRIVHEATRDVANRSVGVVVPGDFIFEQLKQDMLQSGVLLRDIDAAITGQLSKGADGSLRSRLCAAIFLIGKLPGEGVAATGVRATPSALADLLIDDLTQGSAALRQQIAGLLAKLVEEGTIMLVGDEYRLQTRESAEWEADFRKRFQRIQADDTRLSSDRATELRLVVAETLKGLTFIQGANKTPRKFEPHYGDTTPSLTTGAVPVWIRDEWSASEKGVREEAQREGLESPIVFVFIPRQSADAYKSALASLAAAQETLDSRPRGSTAESVEARSAMEARHRLQQNHVRNLTHTMINGARVFQGGGIEVVEGTLPQSLRAAIEAALVRLYPDFHITDQPGWGTAVKRAGDGATDALTAVGFQGDVDKHPACKLVRDFVGGAGKKGADIRRHFMRPPFGWPQDAVDGSLLALMSGGFVNARLNGQPIGVKNIVQSQIGVIDFYSEGVTLTAVQRIQVRKLLTDLGLPVKTGEEGEAIPRILAKLQELAAAAGGAPPLPAPPDTSLVEELRHLKGNEQIAAIHQHQESLRSNFAAWTKAGELAQQRRPQWDTLLRLLAQAGKLPVADQVQPQVEAIRTGRTLLNNPDPVAPLLKELSNTLRLALQEARQRFVTRRQLELDSLASSAEWQSLPQAEQAQLIASHGLAAVPELQVSTEQALLASLEATSLVAWENRIAALPTKLADVREAAAKLIAPQAVRVNPPHATLNSAAEVDAYLAQLRATIMTHIDEGKPVIL